MGEVYLALDTRLDRKVALKLLSPQFTSDAERVLRFTQEARAASALNHPNIITIYDIGESNGTPYIATEFIDGQTLREKLGSHPLPLAQALDYAIQTAGALAAAHQAGIIHRDIKPENIMVRADGYVKVVDFGLAKLTERAPDPQDSGTVIMSPAVTTCGTVMGTAQYMSPEQARGLPVDGRSDIFSLGVVVYEMLAGSAPFVGETAAHSIVAILERTPPPLTGVSPDLRAVVEKCLAKDVAARYQSASSLASDLKSLVEHGATPAREVQAKPIATSLKSRSRARALLALPVLLFLARFAWIAYNRLAPHSTPFQNFTLEELTDTGKVRAAVISPDGRYVVYTQSERGMQSLHMRQVVAGGMVQIQPAGPQRYAGLSFSSDGNYLFFVRQDPGVLGSTLYRISTLGGDPQRILDNVYSSVSFSPDGQHIAYLTIDRALTEMQWITARLDGSDLRKIKATKPPIITTSEPLWSPDGKWIAAAVVTPGPNGFRGAPVLVPAAGGAEKTLGPARWGGILSLVWTPDSKALLAVGTTPGVVTSTQIWHIPVYGGEPRQLTNDVTNYASLSCTADGKALLAVKVTQLSGLYTVNVDDPASMRQIVQTGPYYAGLHGLNWSPDGKLIYTSKAGNGIDFFMRDLDEGSTPKRLTNDNAFAMFAQVVAGGKKLYFSSNRVTGVMHIWAIDIPSGDLSQITSGPGEVFSSATADGKTIFYVPAGGQGVFRIPAEGGTPVQVISKTGVGSPSVSPDGQYLAVRFVDQAAGRHARIGVMPANGGDYVKTFDPATPASGGADWTPDGTGLTYMGSVAGVGQLWLQPIAGGPPRQLTHFTSDVIFGFAWSPDGKQLVVSRGSPITDAVLIRQKN
jgi:serine/threonine protein kinase/Tol biopolymer transport system component